LAATRHEIELAEKLAKHGKEMNLGISASQENLFVDPHSADWFTMAIAECLIWTGHAVRVDHYFEVIARYLTLGNTKALEEMDVFAGRFGPDKLISAVRGWKSILTNLYVPDVSRTDAHGLCEFQRTCMETALRLFYEKELRGVGAWLFCAPFKIVVAWRKEFWERQELDDLLMPLGLEVNRGLQKLIRQRATYGQNLTKEHLSEEEGTLPDGLATVYMVQDMSRKIASIANTRVLHVNSGLYLYGADEFE